MNVLIPFSTFWNNWYKDKKCFVIDSLVELTNYLVLGLLGEREHLTILSLYLVSIGMLEFHNSLNHSIL